MSTGSQRSTWRPLYIQDICYQLYTDCPTHKSWPTLEEVSLLLDINSNSDAESSLALELDANQWQDDCFGIAATSLPKSEGRCLRSCPERQSNFSIEITRRNWWEDRLQKITGKKSVIHSCDIGRRCRRFCQIKKTRQRLKFQQWR